MKHTSITDGFWRRAAGLLSATATMWISGCGGGGGTSLPAAGPGGNTGGGGQTSGGRAGTALFHVDVPTGQVTVTPLAGAKAAGRAVFAGSTVSFAGSLLLDKPGDVGIKTLSVSLTNHFALPIGQTPDGVVTGTKVLFSAFTNVASLTTDLRSKTQVSTLAGSVTGFADGPAASAKFAAPFGSATDGSGAVYVADTGNHRVRKILNGLVTTLAGNGTAAHKDGSGAAAGLNAPVGVAVNPVDHALIVVELTGRDIRRITPDGAVTTVAGTGSSGAMDGLGSVATFTSPIGVAVNSSGTIYVTDQVGTLRRITLNNGANPRSSASYTVSTAAGGVSGFADGVGPNAQFHSPSGIAVDDAGVLYVADTANRRIRRVSPSGEVVTIAGTGVSGTTNGTGDQATFGAPQGIAFANGALYVSDNTNNQIRQITLTPNAAPASASSWRVATLAGTGAAGAVNGAGNIATFSGPTFLSASSGGSLSVVDRANNRIRTVTPANGFLPIGIPTGSAPAEPVQLSNADGLVPVPETGANLNYIAYDGALAAGATSAAKDWSFIIPSGVTAFEFTVTVEASTTSLAPPESVNNGSSGGGGSPNVVVRTLVGGKGGYVDGQLAAAAIANPRCIAVDRAGNLYVGTFDGAIRRIGTNGNVSTIAGGLGAGFADGPGNVAQFGVVRSIAVTSDGTELYVTDWGNQRVRRIFNSNPAGDVTNPSSWMVTTIAGTGILGGAYQSAPGDTATLDFPYGLAMGPGPTLYVSEQRGDRIRQIRFTGGDPGVAHNWIVSLLAGDASAADGASGTTDGNGASARFFQPEGVALDRSGKLYVSDTINYRVRVVTPEGTVTTLAGGVSGGATQSGYVDGAGPVALFHSPIGIAVDGAGFVYVADFANDRIRRISPTGVVTTVAGTSGDGYHDGTGDVAKFYLPQGVAVDSAGTIFVCDVFNNAIRTIHRVINGP